MSEELRKGEPVRYFPGFRDGPSKLGRIQHDGLRQLGGTDGYYVDGAGFISAAHIEPLDHRDGTIYVKTVAEALAVSDWEGVIDVVITDNAERLKLQKILKGWR